jgi:nitroimidazol reductase NimA-like FMN-containing flavoprotein (pyridoxamine 5'-phosphate oxidase superfamily)
MVGELTKNEINNILQSQSIGRLACVDKNNNPYLIPICYYYDGKSLYAQSREGKKIDILRTHPNVCFQVDIINNSNNWKSVIVYGTFEELKGQSAITAKEELFNTVLTLMTNSASHKFEHESSTKIDDSLRSKSVIFAIHVKEVTGRFEKQ